MGSTTDKTIRLGTDISNVISGNKKVEDSYSQLHKKVTDAAAQGRKLNQQEYSDLQKKISLYEKELKLQEEISRKRLQSRQLDVQYAEKDNAEWRAGRNVEANSLKGAARSKHVTETSIENAQRVSSLYSERKQVFEEQSRFNETREDNKKQISELREITGTIKQESGKDRKTTETVFSRIQGNAPAMAQAAAGGSGSALLEAGLGMIGLGAIGGILTSMVGTIGDYQESLKNYSVSSRNPLATTAMYAEEYRFKGIGVSPDEALEKAAVFTNALKVNTITDPSLIKGLLSLEVGKGLTVQQISQLLNIQRYTNTSTLGTAAAFDSFVRDRDNGSDIRLIEIIDSYLNQANSILHKVGRVDAAGLQQTIMSIGKSYGVSGLSLDRMTGGVLGLAGKSSDSIMTGIQMETLREMYPGMSTWDMYKKIQNPSSDKEYIKRLMNRMNSFSGGGDMAKWLLSGKTGLGGDEIDLMVKNKFELANVPRDSGDRAASEKFYSEAVDYAGSVDKISTAIGGLGDSLKETISDWVDSLVDLYKVNGVHENSTARGVSKGNEFRFYNAPKKP